MKVGFMYPIPFVEVVVLQIVFLKPKILSYTPKIIKQSDMVNFRTLSRLIVIVSFYLIVIENILVFLGCERAIFERKE